MKGRTKRNIEEEVEEEEAGYERSMADGRKGRGRRERGTEDELLG